MGVIVFFIPAADVIRRDSAEFMFRDELIFTELIFKRFINVNLLTYCMKQGGSESHGSGTRPLTIANERQVPALFFITLDLDRFECVEICVIMLLSLGYINIGISY